MPSESMLASKGQKRRSAPNGPKGPKAPSGGTEEMVKLFLPSRLARKARAHAAMNGKRGPRYTIELALEQFFTNSANIQTL